MRIRNLPLVALLCGFTTIMLAGTTMGESVKYTYSAAVIYYYDWDIRTRSPMSVDDVRRKHHMKITIRGDSRIRRFKSLARLGELNPRHDSDEALDVRLVIDLVHESGLVQTYVADNFGLYSIDGREHRAIDDTFKQMFRLF